MGSPFIKFSFCAGSECLCNKQVRYTGKYLVLVVNLNVTGTFHIPDSALSIVSTSPMMKGSCRYVVHARRVQMSRTNLYGHMYVRICCGFNVHVGQCS